MVDYTNGYIYPPRPELKVPPDCISDYDNGQFLAQPKLNGTCCEIYSGLDRIRPMGRHNNYITNFRLDEIELRTVFGYGNNLIIGEYLNKSKKDKNNEIFNHKFVIFDQLVSDGKYFLGTTFKERYDILLSLYKPISEDEFLYQISENIFLVKSFYYDFMNLWLKLADIDMYEGLVFKLLNGKLERGLREKNNDKIQFKSRKETKNYIY